MSFFSSCLVAACLTNAQNRLLSMIRTQQSQIQQLQTAHPQPSTSTSAVEDDAATPTSERSMSLPRSTSTSIPNPTQQPQQALSQLPASVQARSHSPFAYNPRGTLSRQSSMAGRSQGNSNTASPALRPSSGHGPYDGPDYLPGPAVHTRDEGVFYQAETQMLTRENQMLKLRIRELGTFHILSYMSSDYTNARHRETTVGSPSGELGAYSAFACQ